jgi:hypothetical protein
VTRQHTYPWPPAAASGVGSFPGHDPDEAMRVIAGELPRLPHLPELPARGVGADMIGRTAALLVEFPVATQPSGWRVTDRPGRDLERARSHLSRDLDAVEEHTQGFSGTLKIQLAGPWTMCAGVELRGGQRLLADQGAVADLTASLVEGLQAHLIEVARRVPGARLLVQVDEPALPSVLLGAVPTASGYSTFPAVDRVVVEERLRSVFAAVEAAGGVPLAHCCASSVPVDLLRRSGARALSLDATLLGQDHDEPIGAAVEDGVGLLLGVVPAVDPDVVNSPAATRADGPEMSDPAAIVDPVRRLWHRIGLPPETATRAVVVTARCGLAGASPGHARAALEACRAAARVLQEDPQSAGLSD